MTMLMDDVNWGALEKVKVTKWNKEDGASREEAFLSIEEPLAIEIDGKKVAILMRLPGGEKELAVGFCLSEGLVSSMKDIVMVHHCGSMGRDSKAGEGLESRNIVRVKTSGGPVASSEDLIMLLVRSGCGRNSLDNIEVDLPICQSNLQISAESLGKMSGLLAAEQKLKRISGGVHSAVLFDREERVVCSYEDVGRHNAMDKVIGYAAMQDIPLQDKIVITTGRTSYEMITKAARVGIPAILSLSLPTSLAVEYAKKSGITLVGGIRRGKFVVYTNPERVLF